MDLDPKKLGLAGGLLWGLVMFIMTWISMYTGYGTMWLTLMSDMYPGYAITAFGSFVGFLYGFADAFIGFFALAWIYNKL